MASNTVLSDPPRSLAARVAETLADAEARGVLAILTEREGPLGVAELAAEVAAKLGDEDPRTVSAETRRHRQTTLYHRTLPRLDSLGFVTVDRERESVELAGASPIDSLGVDLARLDADASNQWEVLATVLAQSRRVSTLGVLAEDPVRPFEDLVIAVAEREYDVPRTRLSDEQVREVEIGLHHADLPKLAEVGLIEAGWSDGPVVLCERRLDRVADAWSLVVPAAESNA